MSVTIDRIPFKHTSADAVEVEFIFNPALIGNISTEVGWEVSNGTYRISMGVAGDTDDSPTYDAATEFKRGWAKIRPGQSLFAKPGAAAAVINFTR